MNMRNHAGFGGDIMDTIMGIARDGARPHLKQAAINRLDKVHDALIEAIDGSAETVSRDSFLTEMAREVALAIRQVKSIE